MPVEIRELIIRVVETAPPQEDDTRRDTTVTAADIEQIVEECVRQVLAILAHKEER